MRRANQFTYPCFYPDQFEESANKFFGTYELIAQVNCPASKMIGLLDKSLRTCRFCKKKMPEVTFRNEAHIIPQFLGNKYLISDFECDNCNALFSKYESDFARYLGIHRAMQSEKESLKFNSSDNNLIVESTPNASEGHLISMTRVNDSAAFEFDKENQLVKVNYAKGVYRPINVYKSILKIALSLLDYRSITDHYAAFTYLKAQGDSMMTGFEIITSYTMPLTLYYEPTAMLFRKKDPAQNLFSHLFVLMFMNHAFQIIVPFNYNDIKFHRPGFVETFWCPPLFSSTTEIQPIFAESGMFDSSEPKVNERGAFVFHQEASMFEEITFIDKETGEPYTEKFDPNKIKTIEFHRIKIS